jgi:NAD-dependent deacetylase
MKCGKKYDFDFMVKSKGIPRCTCGGIVRPDVVLYQEQLPTSALAAAIDHIKKADTLIVAGTSLVVYPAAGLIRYFTGNNMVIINKSTTDYDRLADLVIHDSVDLVLDAIVK